MKLSNKLFILILFFIAIGSLFNYVTTIFLYEHFYVEHQENHLKGLGLKVAEFYNGEEISADFRRKITEINEISNEDIILAEDLSILGECLPIKEKTQKPFSVEEMQSLKNGKTVTIVEEHTKCNKDVIVVTVPLINSSGELIAAIFTFTPLATVNEAVSQVNGILILYTVIMLMIGIILAKLITSKMTKPLDQMQAIAKRMMDGDFEAKVEAYNDDEIGRLGKTLNHLSNSLRDTITLLAKEKKQLTQILDGIKASVITVQRNGEPLLCNTPAKNLFRKLGISREKFMALPDIANLVDEVKRKKEVIVEDIKLHNQVFVLYLAPLTDEEVLWGIVMVIHDVTEEKNRMNDAREFLAIVSHELRTPLSYVKGYTEALMDGVADSQDKKERYLSTIHNETERMERLVNGLLELAQLERGTYPIKKEKIQLDGVVTEVLERYEVAYNEKGIRLSYINKDSSPLWVNGDEDRIIQILLNLLDNALRHTSEGGAVTIATYRQSDDLVLEISDTGEGIEEKHLKKLGEKFFRVDKSRSRKKGGYGLGLAIVKQIVGKLNGRMEVTSVINEGTTFRIFFPFIDE